MMRLLTEIPHATQKVIVRLDLNVPLKGEEVVDTLRIERATKTIQFLKARGYTIYILSHLAQGSLRLIVPTCETLWDMSVTFAPDCLLPPTKGDVVLFENIRMHPQEKENDLAFAKTLSSLGELYINDAFSCCHRMHASIDAITHFLPSYAGFGLMDEVSYLDQLLEKPRQPFVAIVGGAKISTKLPLLKNLLGHVDTLLIGGAMSNTFLRARGYEIGGYEPDLVEMAKTLDATGKCVLPIDVVLEKEGVVSLDQVMPEDRIFDIGPETICLFANVLEKAKTVVWNGPMGCIERPPFNKGTFELIRVLQSLQDTCVVVGGGETAATFQGLPLLGISFLSTGGGAFLSYLEGQKLPGIAALERSFQKNVFM